MDLCLFHRFCLYAFVCLWKMILSYYILFHVLELCLSFCELICFLCSWRWRSQLMWRVFFTSAVVAVVVRTAMSWCKDERCGHFGSGGFIIWDVSELRSKLCPSYLPIKFLPFLYTLSWFFLFLSGQEDYSFVELLPMAIIGVIGGLLGNILYLHFVLTPILNFSWLIYFIANDLQEPCLTSLRVILLLGAVIIFTRKGFVSRCDVKFWLIVMLPLVPYSI